MTVEHMDNFSVYGTGDDSRGRMLDGVYADVYQGTSGQNEVVASPDGDGLALVVFSQANSDGLVRYVLQTPAMIFGMCCRLWLPGLPETTDEQNHFSCILDASNTIMAYCYVGTVGNIIVAIPGQPGGDTIVPVITANAFYHLEVIYDITAQTIEVFVEGVSKIKVTAAGMENVNVSSCRYFQYNNSAQQMFLKDVFYWNGLGTENNSQAGALVIYSIDPDADINTNWTPSTGTEHYVLINEDGPPNDTQYITADISLPPAYIASLTQLPSDVTTVRALMSMVRASKTDGGDGNLQIGFIGATATELGQNRPITAAFTYWRDFSETDPSTNEPWLPSAIATIQMQFNRTV